MALDPNFDYSQLPDYEPLPWLDENGKVDPSKLTCNPGESRNRFGFCVAIGDLEPEDIDPGYSAPGGVGVGSDGRAKPVTPTSPYEVDTGDKPFLPDEEDRRLRNAQTDRESAVLLQDQWNNVARRYVPVMNQINERFSQDNVNAGIETARNTGLQSGLAAQQQVDRQNSRYGAQLTNNMASKISSDSGLATTGSGVNEANLYGQNRRDSDMNAMSDMIGLGQGVNSQAVGNQVNANNNLFAQSQQYSAARRAAGIADDAAEMQLVTNVGLGIIGI